MLMNLCQLAFGSEFVANGLVYEVNEDSTSVSVTRSEDNTTVTDVIIPDKVDYDGVTYPVTAIGYAAFIKVYKLTSVKIGNNVQSIGAKAFSMCYQLSPFGVSSTNGALGGTSGR